MTTFGSDTEFYKIAIWHNEMPLSYPSNKKIEMTIDPSKCIWKEGTTCIEARLNWRDASSYAMICMRYIHTESDKTKVFIHCGNHSTERRSDNLFNPKAVVGLEDEYAEVISDFFTSLDKDVVPSGTIEIMGAHDEVGSSIVAFKCVMKLLMWILFHYDQIGESSFGDELLSKAREWQHRGDVQYFL